MQALSSKHSSLGICDEGSFLGIVEMCSVKTLFSTELYGTKEIDVLRIFGFPAKPFIPTHLLEYIPNPNAFLLILIFSRKNSA